MFVGATATSVTTFRARPAEAHAVLCAVLRRLRAQGVLTTRLGRGAYLCDADAATLVVTLAPPADHRPGTYLLSGTVTGSEPSELTRSLLACVEDIGRTTVTVPDSRRPQAESHR